MVDPRQMDSVPPAIEPSGVHSLVPLVYREMGEVRVRLDAIEKRIDRMNGADHRGKTGAWPRDVVGWTRLLTFIAGVIGAAATAGWWAAMTWGRP